MESNIHDMMQCEMRLENMENLNCGKQLCKLRDWGFQKGLGVSGI